MDETVHYKLVVARIDSAVITSSDINNIIESIVTTTFNIAPDGFVDLEGNTIDLTVLPLGDGNYKNGCFKVGTLHHPTSDYFENRYKKINCK